MPPVLRDTLVAIFLIKHFLGAGGKSAVWNLQLDRSPAQFDPLQQPCHASACCGIPFFRPRPDLEVIQAEMEQAVRQYVCPLLRCRTARSVDMDLASVHNYRPALLGTVVLLRFPSWFPHHGDPFEQPPEERMGTRHRFTSNVVLECRVLRFVH